jgi:hypothetical protein
METGRLNGLPELEIAVLAKNGDKDAAGLLWAKYRKPMANVFWGLPMTREERESEAADVFMHYIKNLFDPGKEENQRQGWTFFSYLYSGMAGRRSKLRRERACLAYDESETDPEAGSGALSAEKLCLYDKGLFTRYDPEEAVVSEICREEETALLRGGISRLQEIRAGYSRYLRGLFRGEDA